MRRVMSEKSKTRGGRGKLICCGTVFFYQNYARNDVMAFWISMITACTARRENLRSAALTTAIVFALVGAFFGILSAYGSFDLRVLEQAGQSEVALVALTSAAIGVLEVFAAFLLVWVLRRIFGARKKN
jgi:hypothetical protein